MLRGKTVNRIKLIRKGDGTAFQNKRKQFVFVKDGVNFALSYEQMAEMTKLFAGLSDGSLIKIDPSSEDMARGE
jgi:hypothetical protein